MEYVSNTEEQVTVITIFISCQKFESIGRNYYTNLFIRCGGKLCFHDFVMENSTLEPNISCKSTFG